MVNQNIGIWNKRSFWCGAFDVTALKVVQVHKYEECASVDFNSYWAFTSPFNGVEAEQLFENGQWVFFWLTGTKEGIRIDLQPEAENCKPNAVDIIQYEGIKTLIRKQISCGTRRWKI